MSERTKWKRPRRLIPVAIAGLVVIGVVGFRVASKGGLQRELAEIRAKGLPTNPRELGQWYAAVPAEENAGVKFLAAHDVYVEPGEGSNPGEVDWNSIPHDAALSAEVVAMLEEHVAKNEETRARMREAAKLKKSRYPADWSQAPETLLPHLAKMKTLASLARWEAVLQAERGNSAEALEGLKCGYALMHTLAQEPVLISELVRMAYGWIALMGTERVLNVAQFSEAELAELAEIIKEAADECGPSLHRAMIGERAFANTGRTLTYDDYEQAFAWGGTPPLSADVPEVVRRTLYNLRSGLGMQSRDHAYYLRSVGRLADAAALKHPQMLATNQALEAEMIAEMNEHTLVYLWSRMSLPALMPAARKEALLEAKLRCAQMAVEIERFRAVNEGRLPRTDELAAVLKEWPIDPADGKRLEYRVEKQGYRVVAVETAQREAKRGTRVVPEFRMLR